MARARSSRQPRPKVSERGADHDVRHRWDDWVPQERVRKLTEENKELARNLKQDMDAQRRASNKPLSTSHKKRPFGSDLTGSSARGSEERSSAVPQAPRGTKRSRDIEGIDKVCCPDSTAHVAAAYCLPTCMTLPKFDFTLSPQCMRGQTPVTTVLRCLFPSTHFDATPQKRITCRKICLPITYVPRSARGSGIIKRALTQVTCQEEDFNRRPAVKIFIPDALKSILVDDWEKVTREQKLVPVPAPTPITQFLNEYATYEGNLRRPGSADADILEEIIAGVKEYFNKALGRILLYRFERQQFYEVHREVEKGHGDYEGKTLCDVYGCEHLLRLFGKLASCAKMHATGLC